MKIAVGSTNPVKVSVVQNVARKIWPEVEVQGIDVPSGVAEQPHTEAEAIEGALNRAGTALQKLSSYYGAGLEAAAIDYKYGTFTVHWVAVVDSKGRAGLGNGGGVMLPEKVAAEIRKGRELGPVMDEFVGGHNTKQKDGAIGILTNNLVTRTTSFEKTVATLLRDSLTHIFTRETVQRFKYSNFVALAWQLQLNGLLAQLL